MAECLIFEYSSIRTSNGYGRYFFSIGCQYTHTIHNNIASISFSEYQTAIGLSYAIWQPDVSNNNLIGIAEYYKIKIKIGVAVNGRYFDYSSYDISDKDEKVKDKFTPKEYTIDMGLSYLIMDGLW